MRVETLVEGGLEKDRRGTVAIIIALVLYLTDLYKNLPTRIVNSFSSMFLILA